jgi:uncharacterized RDD family membrane protein YckC
MPRRYTGNGAGEPAAEAGPSTARPAGLPLVFAAAFYDALLCVALMFVASTVAVAFNDGAAIASGNNAFRILLLAVPFPYFGWCWTRGGHTLGMRAWRLRLRCMDEAPVTWLDALVRYVGALVSWAAFGLGFLWMLTPAGLSWHDRFSGTRVFREA